MESLSNLENLMPDAARQEKVKAAIDAYNAERPTIVRNCYLVSAVAMTIYVALAAILVRGVYGADEKHKVLGIIVALAIFGGMKLWQFTRQPIRDHQLALRYRLFPEIFGFIDGISYSHGHAPGFVQEINQMKMVRFSSTENDDVISGTHDGLFFELVEAKLVLGSGKNKETVFQGLIFHFRLDHAFPGLLFAAKRGNWLQEWVRDTFGSSADLVASGNWEVDETHEFHTDSYAAAKPLVEGPLASALIYLKSEWPDGEARIALRDDECYLLLPSRQDYFALPDIHTDIAYEDVRPMIREMAVLLAVAHLIQKVNSQEAEPVAMVEPGAG